MDTRLLFLISCFIARLSFSLSASGELNSFESVPDLEKSMYTIVDGYPCVRLLNLSGEIGCSNPGHGKVAAPVVKFKNVNQLVEPSAILVSLDELDSLLARHVFDDSIYPFQKNNRVTLPFD
ncbi:unnamed protein product [Coffea canephora]|uniref:Nicastrin n=1 Tax=Coffea canephora TaxID=49390 RepID=A0A068U0G3_COFCA|nr:unnamed protein product [Coffea canephora]